MDHLKVKIRHVPDFPKPGILFYDVTTLLKDPEGFREVIEGLLLPFASADVEVVAGIESRGFIFGAAVADRLGVGFVPVRKPGKLPWHTLKATYELEYGTDSLEIHTDAVSSGQRVLIVDDLLATGGTARAAATLLREAGADVVGISVAIELVELGGRERLGAEIVNSLLQY